MKQFNVLLFPLVIQALKGRRILNHNLETLRLTLPLGTSNFLIFGWIDVLQNPSSVLPSLPLHHLLHCLNSVSTSAIACDISPHNMIYHYLFISISVLHSDLPSMAPHYPSIKVLVETLPYPTSYPTISQNADDFHLQLILCL